MTPDEAVSTVAAVSDNWVAVALAALTLITVIVNAVIQRFRETRQRQWDLEDRAARNQASVDRTKELRDDLDDTRRHIGQGIAAITAVTVNTAQELKTNTAKTIEATEAAQRAYDESAAAREEANGLQEKLNAIANKVRGGPPGA